MMNTRLSRTEKRFLTPEELDLYKHLRRQQQKLVVKSLLALIGTFFLLVSLLALSSALGLIGSHPDSSGFAGFAIYFPISVLLLIPGALAMAHVPIPGVRGQHSTPWQDYIVHRIRPVAQKRRVNTMLPPYPPSPLIDRAAVMKIDTVFPPKTHRMSDFFVGLGKAAGLTVMIGIMYVTVFAGIAALSGLSERTERLG
ncbi:MAG: hypothetical protein ACYCVY_11735 [Acidiferrobacteraceae bacterium]